MVVANKLENPLPLKSLSVRSPCMLSAGFDADADDFLLVVTGASPGIGSNAAPSATLSGNFVAIGVAMDLRRFPALGGDFFSLGFNTVFLSAHAYRNLKHHGDPNAEYTSSAVEF